METQDLNRLPIFLIKDLWKAEKLSMGFRLNQLKFLNLILCGTITSIEFTTTDKIIILVDDGTSTIKCMLDQEESGQDSRQLPWRKLGVFVRIFGKLRCDKRSRYIFVDKIELYNTIKQREYYLKTIIDLYGNYYPYYQIKTE